MGVIVATGSMIAATSHCSTYAGETVLSFIFNRGLADSISLLTSLQIWSMPLSWTQLSMEGRDFFSSQMISKISRIRCHTRKRAGESMIGPITGLTSWLLANSCCSSRYRCRSQVEPNKRVMYGTSLLHSFGGRQHTYPSPFIRR